MPHSLDSGACGLRDPQSAGSLTALRDFTHRLVALYDRHRDYLL